MIAIVRPTRRRTVVGATIVAVLIAIALGIFFLDAVQRAVAETYEIVGVFPTATDVRSGTAVAVAGHEVGTVRRIEFRPGATTGEARPIAATIVLPADARPLVRRDSELRIRQPLAQSPIIEIAPGSRRATPLEDGDTLLAAPPADRERVEEVAATVMRSVDSVAAATRFLLQAGRATEPDVRRAVDAMRAARDELDRLRISGEDGTVARLMRDQQWRERLQRIQAAGDSLSTAVRRRAVELEALRIEGAGLDAELDRVVLRADTLRAEIRRFEEAFAQGLPGRLARDPALRLAIQGVRAQLDSLIAEATRNPLRFIF